MSKQEEYNKRSDAYKRLESDLKKNGLSASEAKQKAREIDARASKAVK